MSTEVQEGQILAGKFRIERVLGRGGMGVVVAATHIQLDERVALKFLLPEALGNAEAVARFAREARAAVKIKSEHVARVSDVGTLESGSPYMVMEYLEGQDLADWVRQAGAMRVPEAVEFVLQASEAIAEAHALGIVHRDLKPANLFVTRRVDGSTCIKVLDFGISKLTVPGSTSDMGMTKTATVMGSPLYMSPEQMSSTRSVDARTDIWALGIILYEVLSGRVPFEAETMPQLCGMILQDPPRPLRQLRPDVPEGLEWVVLRCLEKNRDARFSSIAELAQALAQFGPPSAQRSAERIARVLGGIPSGAPSMPGSIQARAGAATDGNFGASQEPKKSRGALFVALPLALIAIAAGTFFLLHKRAPESVAEPASSTPLAATTALAATPPAQNVAPLAAAPATSVEAAPSEALLVAPAQESVAKSPMAPRGAAPAKAKAPPAKAKPALATAA
ncbi:MAG TPA: serine/threonine-protein kinase, partial [Polyangiaceae bacterium]|nr:serine/threonine-protein kinase [Polyangiaceae bacterium]